MGLLWGVCATERQLASWETVTEGLKGREWIKEEMVVMLTKVIVLSV